MKYKVLLLIYILLAIEIQAQNVGIGTSTPNANAKLDVQSTNSGLLPPRLSNTQRNAILSPPEGLIIYNTTTKCLEYWNGVVWVSNCQSSVPSCYQNCLQIKTASPASPDGVYTIDPDCGGAIAPFQCYCDMTTDGGGWTLVLNYLHQGGVNPALQVRTIDLPLLGSTTLGVNEGGTAFWGHSSNALLNAIPSTEFRFYAKTSNHARAIHFKSSLATCLNYFKTGIGTCNGIVGSFTALAGHSSNIPTTSNFYNTNAGSNAMTHHPFWEGCNRHWEIGFINGGTTRWEADDCTCACCGPGCLSLINPHTFHQVWVR